jgi:hypothetical protein
LDRGEAVQLVLLSPEPVFDRLDHGQLLVQLGGGGLGVGRGQGGGLGVLEVVGTAGGLLVGLLLLVLASAEEAPGDPAAGGLCVAVVACGLVGACFDEAGTFDVESGHVVAARAGHE